MSLVVPELRVPCLPEGIQVEDGFSSPRWAGVAPVILSRFHPRSSNHRPRVEVRIASTARSLHLVWRIYDRWVVSRTTVNNLDVCHDSCIECFLAPPQANGYINIEINAGGTILASHVTATNPFASRMFDAPALARVRRRSTLPVSVDPEILIPCTWEMATEIPYSLLSDHLGIPVGPCGHWRANLYKCADHSSYPHWAAWSPIGELLNFHQPDRFGVWRFD